MASLTRWICLSDFTDGFLSFFMPMIFKVIHKYDEHAAPLGAPPPKKTDSLGPRDHFSILSTHRPPPTSVPSCCAFILGLSRLFLTSYSGSSMVPGAL